MYDTATLIDRHAGNQDKPALLLCNIKKQRPPHGRTIQLGKAVVLVHRGFAMPVNNDDNDSIPHKQIRRCCIVT